MTFFDITPAGAFVNAMEAAAEAEKNARRRETAEPPKPARKQTVSIGIWTRIREAFASAEHREVRAA